MQTWPVQHAKARFSELLEKCLTEGPQMVTKRGAETAVLVPADEWRRVQASAKPSLKELLLSNDARTKIPVRAGGRRVGVPPPPGGKRDVPARREHRFGLRKPTRTR